MSYSQSMLLLLVAGMLFTGTINTILNKLQDLTCVENCDARPSEQHHYEQPIWQTLTMFIGEALCLLVYIVSVSSDSLSPTDAVSEAPQDQQDQQEPSNLPIEMTGKANFLLWIPTMCDLTATTLMNVGLIYISASIYQMLRGSVVLFTGILSSLFLKRRHPRYRWFALLTIFLGVLIVGLAGILQKGHTEKVAIIGSPVGIFMVVLAQVFTAIQFVIEEKIMHKYTVPALKAVGLEGIFGLITVLVFLPILHFTYGVNGPPGNFADIVTGFHQTFDYSQVWISGIGIFLSIAFFNWFGLTVTRNISATSRSTIDTCRTIFIWIISLALQWETFKSLQVVGFIVLIYGTFIFNDVIAPPPLKIFQTEQDSIEEEPLLDDVEA